MASDYLPENVTTVFTMVSALLEIEKDSEQLYTFSYCLFAKPRFRTRDYNGGIICVLRVVYPSKRTISKLNRPS